MNLSAASADQPLPPVLLSTRREWACADNAFQPYGLPPIPFPVRSTRPASRSSLSHLRTVPSGDSTGSAISFDVCSTESLSHCNDAVEVETLLDRLNVAASRSSLDPLLPVVACLLSLLGVAVAVAVRFMRSA